MKPETMKDRRIVTDAELARVFDCSRSKLKKDRMEGKGFPFLRLPGSRSIRYDLDECLERARAEGFSHKAA